MQMWEHKDETHRYWCPSRVTPGDGTWTVYVQRDPIFASRACFSAASALVKFHLESGLVDNWPRRWASEARSSLQATLRSVRDAYLERTGT